MSASDSRRNIRMAIAQAKVPCKRRFEAIRIVDEFVGGNAMRRRWIEKWLQQQDAQAAFAAAFDAGPDVLLALLKNQAAA